MLERNSEALVAKDNALDAKDAALREARLADEVRLSRLEQRLDALERGRNSKT